MAMLTVEKNSKALQGAFKRINHFPQPVVGEMIMRDTSDSYPDSSGGTYSDTPYVDCPYDDYQDNDFE